LLVKKGEGIMGLKIKNLVIHKKGFIMFHKVVVGYGSEIKKAVVGCPFIL